MACKNPVNNDKCSKCVYDILNNDFTFNKTLVDVARIAVNISWMNEFDETESKNSRFSSINISCTGRLSVVKATANNDKLSISVIKHVCTTLFNNWYLHHPLSKKLNSYTYIQNKLLSIDETFSICNIRTILLSIVKYIYSFMSNRYSYTSSLMSK